MPERPKPIVVLAWRVALGWECYAIEGADKVVFVGTYKHAQAVERRLMRMHDARGWGQVEIEWIAAGERVDRLTSCRKHRDSAD